MQYALQTDRLRPRQRDFFFGFTTGEIEKMEKLFLESGPEETTTKEFCSKLAGSFIRSSGRAGKPLLKWTEVQKWFMERQKEWNQNQRNGHVKKDVSPLSNGKADSSNVKEYSSNGKEDSKVPRGQKNQGSPNLEFEAKSSKDGAWYDVDMFLAHRFISGEAEVLVRFCGFGPDEDEWVNIKDSVRERSIPLENSECNRLKVGDFVLCFQEKRDQAIYYDAHIKEIQRKVHDIRGCRCLFLIRYDHDSSEEKVKLRRLCRRPTW